MTRPPLAAPLLLTALAACSAPSAATTDEAASTTEAPSAPATIEPGVPLTPPQRACAIGAAAAFAGALSPEEIELTATALEAALAPPPNEEIRFQQLVKNWNVDWDPGRVTYVEAHLTPLGRKVEGIARSVDDVAELMYRVSTGFGPGWPSVVRRRGDAFAFAFYVGAFPASNNPFAALDTTECAGAVSKELGPFETARVTFGAAPEGFEPLPAAPLVVEISPIEDTPEPTARELLATYEAELHRLERAESRRRGASLACAASFGGLVTSFAFADGALAVTAPGADISSCEGVEVARDADTVTLRDVVALRKADEAKALTDDEVEARLDRVQRVLLIAREKLPAEPALASLLARIESIALTGEPYDGDDLGPSTTEVELVGLKTTQWARDDAFVTLRVELELTGDADAIVGVLMRLSRMTRVLSLVEAEYDAATRTATLALDTYYTSQ